MKNKVKRLLFFLLFFFIICFSEQAKATEKFPEDIAEMEINYGVDGYFRTGSTLPVNFRFKKVKRPFKGRIEFRYFSDNDASCSVIKEINLEKGKEHEKCFYPFLNTVEPNFYVVILDEVGRKVWEKESDIDLFDVDISSDIVIGEVDGAGNGYNFKGESKFNIKKKRIHSKSFPTQAGGLKSFDILVIPDGFLEGSLTKEKRLIRERKRAGGLVFEEREIGNIDLYRALLSKSDRQEWIWRVEKVIGTILRNLSVKGGRYIFVLVLYILMVSPISYFILYHRKRRNRYFLAVPIFSLLFTIIMYIVGTDSRISGLRINYISLLDFREGKSLENTFFAVTNSTNRSYDVTMNNAYRVEPAFGLYNQTPGELKDGRKIKRIIYERKERTDITIGEGTAFETVYFKAEGDPELSYGSMGSVHKERGVVKGNFQNKLGVELDNVFLLYDDEVIHLGGVGKDEKKEIDAEKSRVFLSDSTTALSESCFLADAFRTPEDSDEASRELLMSFVLGKLVTRKLKEPMFLAVTKDRISGEFANKVGASDGYSILLLTATKEEEAVKRTFINSINKLNYRISGSEDSFLYNAFSNRSSIVVTYFLPKGNFSRLSFYRRYNGRISPFTISLRNTHNGKYDVAFSPDKDYMEDMKKSAKSLGKELLRANLEDDKSFFGLEHYIEANSLTVKYDVDPKDYEIISSYFLPQIPKLSLE